MNKSNSSRCGLIALVLLAASWEVRAAPPTSQPVRLKPGEITRVKDDHITAMPWPAPKQGQPNEPVTYLMDGSTRISVWQLVEEHMTPDGRRKKSYQSKPGNRSDLKVGLPARIEANGETAKIIIVFIDTPRIDLPK